MKVDFNPAYTGSREDIVRCLSSQTASRILDVGCGTGALGESIKKFYCSKITGIERDNAMAAMAATKLDSVIVGDVEHMNLETLLTTKSFTSIIFADSLEHFINPWGLLLKCVELLEDNGVVIASIPNIRHFHVFTRVFLHGDWPYRERGIFDKTHLRFFTLKTIRSMFSEAGLVVDKVIANYRLIERPHKANRISKYMAIFGLKEFLTFQFIVVAKKKRIHENIHTLT